ncbi:SlyX family protein [Arenibaculum pallidiluteum]|uniref:SlyX family protein n=1 Tax=Arenibaculum pallidiluteum TaxID=2812559 RepID=UPI001A96900C|nr:SlyX family protein [Arenibaculum pallidiluteum]
MSDPIEQRLVDLEIRAAHQERTIEELSSVLARQDRAIDALTARLRRLTERLLALEGGWERSPQDDRPPPHY